MKKNQKNRAAFIAQSILIFCAIGFFLWCLTGVISEKYPSADSLVYEECAFVRCEYKSTAKSSRYYIYVEEYEKPLEIDNIVIGQIDREALLALEEGDTITISKYEGRKEYTLYSMSHGETDILSYENYLSKHTGNNTTGIVVCSILLCMTVGLCIGSVVLYRKTGECLLI